MKKFIVTILILVGILMQSFAPSSDTIQKEEEKTIKIQLDNNLKLYQDNKVATMEQALNKVAQDYTFDVESRAILYQKLSSLVDMHLNEDKTFNLSYILKVMDIKMEVLIDHLRAKIIKQKHYYRALWGLFGLMVMFLVISHFRNWTGQWIFALFSLFLLLLNVFLYSYFLESIEVQIIKELLKLSG